ncbi:MAG: hypothetical protein AAF228_01330, partial [Pseudomonadota bacterium]
ALLRRKSSPRSHMVSWCAFLLDILVFAVHALGVKEASLRNDYNLKNTGDTRAVMACHTKRIP